MANGGDKINIFEWIKNMTLDEMVEFLTQEHCQECYYTDLWERCQQITCWCHKNNGYKTYKNWLQEVIV